MSLVQDAGSASQSGDCDAARESVQQAQLQLDALPRRTDQALKQNIADWLDHLDQEIEQNCGKDEDETPTPTPSADGDADADRDAHADPHGDADPDAHADADRDPGADGHPGPGHGR